MLELFNFSLTLEDIDKIDRQRLSRVLEAGAIARAFKRHAEGNPDSRTVDAQKARDKANRRVEYREYGRVVAEITKLANVLRGMISRR